MEKCIRRSYAPLLLFLSVQVKQGVKLVSEKWTLQIHTLSSEDLSCGFSKHDVFNASGKECCPPDDSDDVLAESQLLPGKYWTSIAAQFDWIVGLNWTNIAIDSTRVHAPSGSGTIEVQVVQSALQPP